MAKQAIRALLILSIAALLCACMRQSDSVSSLLSVSFEGKPIATLNASLRCSYAWAYFSEQDMASHYNVTPTPAKAPNVFMTLPDTRVLSLTPQPWPPLDETGRCNTSKLYGWQALVLDPRKPVPLLRIISNFDESAVYLSGITLHPSSGDGAEASSQGMTAPLMLRQAVEKASSLEFVVLDVSRDGDMSTKIPAESVSALWALPSDRPSVLLPAQRSDAPLNPDDADSKGALVGLPNFRPTKVMNVNASSDYPSAPGLPISVDPYGPGLHDKVYFPSDVPTPSVTLPDLEKPVMIAPAAAVWYPVTRRLVVFTWTRRSGELTKLIN